jgi:hypothetical protein
MTTEIKNTLSDKHITQSRNEQCDENIMKPKIKIMLKPKIKLKITSEYLNKKSHPQCNSSISADDAKHKIIELFTMNIRGREIDTHTKKDRHCGKEGHWLEEQMGITHNSKSAPDIYGYEMKKSSNKITFGDFSATEYIFSKKKPLIDRANKWENGFVSMDRTTFIRYFGTPKNDRYSWSGSCVPTYGIWNKCGQMLSISNNDICIYYSYSKDNRSTKESYPSYLKNDNVLIAIWSSNKLGVNVNKKFGDKGFFICQKNGNIYDKICFGKPFNFEYFIENVKNKSIIFDSGMYEGNSRNYSQFRSSYNNFWEKLITEVY